MSSFLFPACSDDLRLSAPHRQEPIHVPTLVPRRSSNRLNENMFHRSAGPRKAPLTVTVVSCGRHRQLPPSSASPPTRRRS